jgi:hypothetical protein
LPLQSRFIKKGPPFLSLVYSSSSSQKSSLFKFKKAFEVIRKNNKDCKETLRRYNFKKPKRVAGTSEQVGPISVSNFEEENHRDNLQQHQEAPLQQEELT